jgi:HTH-type transcriptional regulator, sugar sensing transcriptional regulator
MDVEILEDLGLTNAEIRVYVALLELGSATAGPIRERCGLQNSVVHRALNSLVGKGLIGYIMEVKRKVYQASDPEHFFDFIDDKKKKFELILPELKKKQEISKKEEKAGVYKGVKGITQVYNTMVNSGAKEYLTFGGGWMCEERMGTTWWVNMHTKRITNKMPSRQVFDETVREFGKDLVKRPKSKVKYVSKEFAQFQETVIAGDFVAIAVFTENAYAFLIEDPLVAEGYRKHFELLWRIARK